MMFRSQNDAIFHYRMDLVLSRIREKLQENRLLGRIFIADLVLSFHYYLLVYINSSFLSQFFSDGQVSMLYVIGSILTIILFINASKILRVIGNYRLIRYCIIAEIIAALGLAFSVSPALIALYFITIIVSITTLFFCFDLLIEGATKEEENTGEIRTAYLTVGNITVIFCTLIVAWILTAGDYYKVYLLSLVFIIPLFPLAKKYFSRFTDGHTAHLRIKESLATYLENKDLYNVFMAHQLLQIFYGFMVIYTPIYLSKYIGFNWTQIGLIFTIMLVPFIIFELPAGWLGDAYWGEKEMMTVGLALMGIFTLFIPFVHNQSFLLWTIILFMTRIGAALLEATSDSYFFKKVDKDNADTIGLYRISGPASYIIAPILATLSLAVLPFQYMFIVLGVLMILGCHYSLSLRDTK